MPRADTQKADLILCGDLHIGNWQPECRSDVYLDALLNKIRWMAALQITHGCPLVFPGDVFNTWKADSELLNKVMAVWPKGDVLAVCGQHDLRNHNLELQDQSAFDTLRLAGMLQDVSQEAKELPKGIVVYGASWGREAKAAPNCAHPVLVAHVTLWEKPFAPGQKPGEATRYLKENKDWQLICTGDNHQTFTAIDGISELVNAGSVMRMRSDQKDFRPCVFLWNADIGNIRQLFIPISPDVISDARCKAAKEREARENEFVARLESDADISFSFNDHIDKALITETEEVRACVLECTGR